MTPALRAVGSRTKAAAVQHINQSRQLCYKSERANDACQRDSVLQPSKRAFSASARRCKEKLVILGSGWAGYGVLRKIDKKRYDVTLVSATDHFVMTPLLAGTAVGTLEFRCALEPVRRFSPAATFYQAWADKINFADRVITCTPSTPVVSSPVTPDTDLRRPVKANDKSPTYEIRYDKLVIAVGAYSQTFGIEGVSAHALFLKSAADARAIRTRVLECFEQAAQPTLTDDDRRKLLSFLVEFAAELHDLCAGDIAQHYGLLSKLVSITVFETSSTVLASFDDRLQQYAKDKFAREGIAIKSGKKVTKVLPAGIEVEGQFVPGGLVVWSTGLAPNPLVQSIKELKKDAKGKMLLTNDRLEALDPEGKAMPDVLAIGDCAAIDGDLLPATAQVATQKAAYTVKKLNRLVKERTMDQPFAFQNQGSLAYIGGWSAVLDRSTASSGPKGAESGKLAFAVWRSAYLSNSLSWRNRFLTAVFWMTTWVSGRDLSRF